MIPENPLFCSYSGTPSSSTRDEVRFWCQDTDEGFWLMTDDEYDYVIDYVTQHTNGNPVWIASVMCNAIAAKFTREVSVSGDGISVDIGSLQRKYLDLAMTLREQHDEEHGNLDLPSLIPASMDTETTPLLFGIGMNDNFQAGLQDYGGRRLFKSRQFESPETEF